jgi:transcriptional regulator with GAF, ATPase, and Fis domain
LTLVGRGHAPGAPPTLVEEDPRPFRTALAELSGRLGDAAPERFAEIFQEGMECVTRTLGVDRCTLAEFTSDRRSLRWTQGFAMPGIPPWPSVDLATLLPWFTEQVRQGRTLVLRHLPDGLPPEAVREAEFVAAIGLKASLAIPLKAAGTVLGCLGVGSFHSFRSWSPDLVSSMELLAALFANALLQRESAERLRAAEEASRLLRDDVRELRDRLDAESVLLQKAALRAQGFDEIVGTSAALSTVLRQIEQVATADSPVLILGETGTGKGVAARAIHDRSHRKNRPLVAVNCAALPDALIESELFGYEKGAFTGAVARTLGRFEVADGGSILLDEIGELPPAAQAKLLRVLEGGTFERLGSSRTIRVNVRVIAATNHDLAQDVREGRFRADLYYRLNVFPLTIPPLRERSEDVPLLVWHFINAKQGVMGRTIKRVPDRLMRGLETYSWPGNIRELENLVERALIVSSGPDLAVDAPFLAVTGQTSSETRLDAVQRSHIEAVLRQCGWKVAGRGNAAERLGLKRGTLQFRMKKLGIRRPAEGTL